MSLVINWGSDHEAHITWHRFLDHEWSIDAGVEQRSRTIDCEGRGRRIVALGSDLGGADTCHDTNVTSASTNDTPDNDDIAADTNDSRDNSRGPAAGVAAPNRRSHGRHLRRRFGLGGFSHHENRAPLGRLIIRRTHRSGDL